MDTPPKNSEEPEGDPAEQGQGDPAKGPLLGKTDLGDLLDHARGLFTYHAGQRLSSIRYFLVLYGVLLAVFFDAANKVDFSLADGFSIAILMTALIFTACFWALDQRNAQLTQVNERAMIELEARIKAAFGLKDFIMNYNARAEATLFQYKYIMHLMFWIFFSFPAAALSFVAHEATKEMGWWNDAVIIFCILAYLGFLNLILYAFVKIRMRDRPDDRAKVHYFRIIGNCREVIRSTKHQQD